tara:strand:- start:236 stop:514 length:279 start_codon:yes stop_codon:yes gene_type:complete
LNKVLQHSTFLESDGEEMLKHSLLMDHLAVQHTSLLMYEKMEESEHISDLKDKVEDKGAGKKQPLDAVCSSEDFPEKSIPNNSEKCLGSTAK